MASVPSTRRRSTGFVPQTSTKRPPRARKAENCCWASGSRPVMPCGSRPEPRRRVADRRRRRPQARRRAGGAAARRPQRADVPHDERAAAVDSPGRAAGSPRRAARRRCGRGRAPASAGARRSSAPRPAVVTFATWWSPKAMWSSTRVRGRVRVGVAREVLRRSRRGRRGPTALDQRQDQRPLELVRVGRVEQRRERRRSRRCASAACCSSSPGRSSAARVKSGATAVSAPPRMPPWLPPAKNRRRVSISGPPAVLEGRVRREAARVDHRAPQEQEVQEALLEAVGQLGEAREVAAGRRTCSAGRSPTCPTSRSRRARRRACARDRRGLTLSTSLGAAEQPVPVERDAPRRAPAVAERGMSQMKRACWTLPGDAHRAGRGRRARTATRAGSPGWSR